MSLDQLSECRQRVYTAADAPIEELGDVDPPHRGLAFVDPTLASTHLGRKVTLGQSGGFSEPNQQLRHLEVGNVKLTFRHS
jgi:hypothetical protein